MLEIIDRAIETGFLAPAPAEKACTWCDFRPVCGPTAERRVSRSSRTSRWPICSSCGGSHDAPPPLSRSAPIAQLIRDGLDDTVIVEAAAGTGKTTELVARILNVLAARPRADRADRRRHLHRKGGGRAEAAHPQGAREPAAARDRRRTCRPTSPTRSSGSRRRTSARFTASAPICCASGRSRPASIRCSRCSPKPRADRIFDEAFRAWLHEQLEDPPEGVRRALRRSVWSRDGRDNDDGPVDRIRRAGARAGRVARLRRRVAPRSVRSRRASCSASSRSVHELAALTARAAVDARSAVSRHRADPRAEPRRRDRRRASTPTIPTAGKRASIDLAQNREPPARAPRPRARVRRRRRARRRSGPRTRR